MMGTTAVISIIIHYSFNLYMIKNTWTWNYHELNIVFLIGKTDLIPLATYTLVCCGLTVLTLVITLMYK
jgi:hypothetical protein